MFLSSWTLPGSWSRLKEALTNSFVGIRRTRDKLENLSPLLSQAPAVKDFSIALLKVIKLLSVGRIQKPRGINRVVIPPVAAILFPVMSIQPGNTARRADYFPCAADNLAER